LALLKITNLTRSFYGLSVLKGVDISVRAGTITGLIGPNGAGKTTLFNCISGVIPPQRGEVIFDGTDLAGSRPDVISRAGLLRTFQIARGFSRLTVLENLMIYGANHPGETWLSAFYMSAKSRKFETDLRDRAMQVAKQLKLIDILDNYAEEISGGQKKLLEIGRALMGKPRLILLDEPIAGVNPTLSIEIGERIHELKKEGYSFLVIEHNMDVIARICDPVIVLADGKKLMEGNFQQVASDARVQDAYMGRSI
jgi:ABC-type branched-subunit amino acid transport system ATPase component